MRPFLIYDTTTIDNVFHGHPPTSMYVILRGHFPFGYALGLILSISLRAPEPFARPATSWPSRLTLKKLLHFSNARLLVPPSPRLNQISLSRASRRHPVVSMARASFFLTKTDVDSIRVGQLKSGVSLLLLVLLDAVATLWLFFGTEGNWNALLPELRRFTTASSFKGGTGDLVFLLILRVLMYATVGGAAVALGKQRNKAHPPPGTRLRTPSSSGVNLTNDGDGDLSEPLLPASTAPSEAFPGSNIQTDDPSSDGVDLTGVSVDNPTPDEDAAGNFDPDLFAPSEDDQKYNANARFRRDVLVELTFLFCVAFQAYVAVKSVAFYYPQRTTLRTVLLFGTSICCIAGQAAYFRKWVKACTVRTGVTRKDFHAHELQFHDRVVGHVCDMCGLRLNAGSKGLRFGGFRCQTCDFDCCMYVFYFPNPGTQFADCPPIITHSRYKD